MYVKKKQFRTLLVFLLIICVFTIPVAADITGGSVDNCNIYGSSGSNTFSPSGDPTGSTKNNITNTSGIELQADATGSATYDSLTQKVIFQITTTGPDSKVNGFQGAAIKTGTTGTISGFSWSHTNGTDTYTDTTMADSDGKTIIDWTGRNAGNYTTTLILANDSKSITVTFTWTAGASTPTITSISSSISHGTNEDKYTLSAVESGGTSYAWYYSTDGTNFTQITGALNKTYEWTPSTVITPTAGSASIPVTIKFTSTNTAGTIEKQQQLMTIYYKPVVTVNGTIPSTVGQNQTVGLSASISSSSDDILTGSSWQVSSDNGSTWNDLSTSMSGTNYIASFSQSTVGTYKVRFNQVSSLSANSTSTPATIQVTNLPAVTATINGTTQVDGGISSSVTLNASSTSTNSYEWFMQENGGTWTSIGTSNPLTQTISESTYAVIKFKAQNTSTLAESNEVTYIAHTLPQISNVTITPTTGGLNPEITMKADIANSDFTASIWQYSTDGGNTWTNVTGSNNQSTYTKQMSFTTTGTIKFRITASNIIGTSTSTDFTNATYTAVNAPDVSGTVTPTTGTLGTKFTLNGKITGSYNSVKWQYRDNGSTVWNDITGATLPVSTWTPTTTGTYYLKIIVTYNTSLTTEFVLKDQISVYTPSTLVLTVSPTSGLLSQTVTLTANITNPNGATLVSQIQTSPTGEAWSNILPSNTSSSQTITFGGTYDLNFTNAGICYFRVVSTLQGTTQQMISDVVSYTAVEKPQIVSVSPVSVTTEQKVTIISNVTGFNTGTYRYQYSTDGGSTWEDLEAPKGVISSNEIEGSILFTTAGTYHIKLLVKYADGIPEIESDMKGPITVTDATTGTLEISETGLGTWSNLYAVDISGGTAPSNVDLKYTTKSGTNPAKIRLETYTNTGTYTTVDTQTGASTYTWSSQTPSISSEGDGRYYRVALLDSSNNVIGYSNTVGCVCYDSTHPTFEDSGISYSDTEEYKVLMKSKNFPTEVIATYAVDTQYVLVVTHVGLFIIDSSITTYTSPSPLKNSAYIGSGYISECDLIGNYLLCKSVNSEIFLVYVPLTLADNETFIGSFGQDVSTSQKVSMDLNSNYILVADSTPSSVTSNEARIYNVVDGSLANILDSTGYSIFGLSQTTSDSQFAYAVFMGKSTSTDIKFITNDGNYGKITISNNPVEINTVAEDNSRFIIRTSSNTAIIDYSLLVGSAYTSFNVTHTRYCEKPLSNASANYTGSVIGGIYGNTIFFIDSTGTINSSYPTSIQPTGISIAKSGGGYSIAGTKKGQISLISQHSGQWAGIQNYAMGEESISVSISFDAHLITTATKNAVYVGIHKKGPDAEDENVLQTLYYAQIQVVDALGNPVPNTAVTVTSATASNTYTTDSYGKIVIQVKPTYYYTLTLPNVEGVSTTICASNLALSYWYLQIPAEESATANATYSAELVDNSRIILSFSDANKNKYDVQWNIFNGDDTTTPLLSYYDLYDPTTTPVKESYHNIIIANETALKDYKSFVVKMTATLDSTSGDTISKTWSFSTEVDNTGDRSERDPLPDAEIPILPIQLDDKWISIIFSCGILVLAGLFGYQHSFKGCLVVAGVSAIATWMGIVEISPIWVAAMVLLAILSVYSFCSQNEGN